jgi:hypothetical protein
MRSDSIIEKGNSTTFRGKGSLKAFDNWNQNPRNASPYPSSSSMTVSLWSMCMILRWLKYVNRFLATIRPPLIAEWKAEITRCTKNARQTHEYFKEYVMMIGIHLWWAGFTPGSTVMRGTRMRTTGGKTASAMALPRVIAMTNCRKN